MERDGNSSVERARVSKGVMLGTGRETRGGEGESGEGKWGEKRDDDGVF